MKIFFITFYLFCASFFALYRFIVRFNPGNKDYFTHKSLPYWDAINGGASDYMYFWGTGKFIKTYGVHKLIDVHFYLDFLQNNVTHVQRLGLWAYPPTINFIISTISLVPFLVSFFLFNFLVLLFSFFTYRKLFSTPFSLILILSPMSFLCYGYGQLGILMMTSILLGLIYTSPSKINVSFDKNMLSGIIFGLCSIKYPFIVLIPFYLIFTKSWKTFFYMILTFVFLILSSLIFYGVQSWYDYFEVLVPLMKQNMENVKDNIFVSPLPSLITLGLPKNVSWVLQLLISFGCVSSLYYAIKNKIFFKKEELYSFILGLTLIATPYSHTYDLILLAPVMVLLMKKFDSNNNKLLFLIFGIWFFYGISDIIFNLHFYSNAVCLIHSIFIFVNLIIFWICRDKKQNIENILKN